MKVSTSTVTKPHETAVYFRCLSLLCPTAYAEVNMPLVTLRSKPRTMSLVSGIPVVSVSELPSRSPSAAMEK